MEIRKFFKIFSMVFIFFACYTLSAVDTMSMPLENTPLNENSSAVKKTGITRFQNFVKSSMQNLKNAKEKVSDFINQKKEDSFYKSLSNTNTNYRGIGNFVDVLFSGIRNTARAIIHGVGSVFGETLEMAESASSAIQSVYESTNPLPQTVSIGINLGSAIDNGIDFCIHKISEGSNRIGSEICNFKNRQEDKKLNKLVEPVQKYLNKNEIYNLKILLKSLNEDQQKQFVALLKLYHQKLQESANQKEADRKQSLVNAVKKDLGTSTQNSKKGKKKKQNGQTPQNILGDFEQLTRNLNETQSDSLGRFVESMNRRLSRNVERRPAREIGDLDFRRFFLTQLLGSSRSIKVSDDEE